MSPLEFIRNFLHTNPDASFEAAEEAAKAQDITLPRSVFDGAQILDALSGSDSGSSSLDLSKLNREQRRVAESLDAIRKMMGKDPE